MGLMNTTVTLIPMTPIKITPDPNRVRSGYAKQSDSAKMAIKELIDNSVLENAENIYIDSIIDGRKRNQLTISDDGDGMPYSKLTEALTPYGLKDGIGGHENGIGGFGSLGNLGTFVHLRTQSDQDTFAYEIDDIDGNSSQEVQPATHPLRSESFFEIQVKDCKWDYQQLAETNLWKSIADIFSEHLASGINIEPRYFDLQGNRIKTKEHPRLWAPPMLFLYPSGNNSTLKSFKDTINGQKVDITIEAKVLDPIHHVKNHPIPVKRGGARVYVDQDNIRCVWGHNQGQLLKNVATAYDHPQLNRFIFYINFKKGRCYAKPIKNQLIVEDPVYGWLQEKLKEYVDNDATLQTYMKPGKPEKIIEDNIIKSLAPIMNHIVKPGGQQHPNNFGGKFDIVSEDSSTKCVWEIKAGKFDSFAFYQFYYYLLKGNFDRGYIVGKGITPEAQKMMDDAKNNDGMDICFIDLSTKQYEHLLI
jgi:hypothetical protein